MTPGVLQFDRIDSTNAEAHRLAAAGHVDPVWISAGLQTAGRGRLGRSWVSEPGNLYVTHMIPVAGGAALASELSFVAGLAMFDTAAELLGTPDGLGLKWPNDLLLSGLKVSGILLETLKSRGGWTLAAIGMGLNLAHAPQGLAYPTAALGGAHNPAGALEILMGKFSARHAAWANGAGFDGIRAAWFERAVGKSGPCEVVQGGRRMTGAFSGLAPDGALLLRTDASETLAIYAGDVHFAEVAALRETA